jgi:WD40 repeat protein
MVRTLIVVVVVLVLLLAAGVYTGIVPIAGFGTRPPVVETKVPKREQLGDDLYTAKPFPTLDPDAGKFKSDPVILRGHVQNKDKQEVPSLVAGQIWFIGEPIPDGVVEVVGAAPFLADPYGYNTVTVGDEKFYKFYRRLLPGQYVQSDQIVGMIECSAAFEALAEKRHKIEYAIYDEKAAKAAADEALSRYERDLVLSRTGGIAPAELSASRAARDKFKNDHMVKVKQIDIAKNELDQAKTLFAKHEIRNKVPYQRCVIQYVHKQRGDPVKDQDVVMTVHSLDHLLAEAMVDSSYLERIRPEMTATIEPTQEDRPYVPPVAAHRGEVTAIAVTNDAKQPRVVSAGTDRVVSVYDGFKGGLPIRLPHDDVVHALVCSPVGAPQNLCFAGAGGKIYIWDVDRTALGDNSTAKPLHVLEDAHPSSTSPEPARITCLALSPDGNYLASGAEDGTIAIWSTAKCTAGESDPLVYRFDPGHGVERPHSDPITSLTFTQQSRLVSAANDKTVRVWHLLQKGAVLEGDPIAGRDGTVRHLGVRSDGKWFLFDRGTSLQFVSIERPGATIAALQNHGSPTPFETLAIFSPDGKFVLSAGLPEGRLQLWKAPTETSRGFEVRQYAPKDRQFPVTCAAFVPQLPYAVSGNAAGEICLWKLPTEAQLNEFRIEHVPVRLLSQSIDSNTHQARIAVDVPNPTSMEYPNGRLMPGKAVTVVIGEE